MYLYHMYVVGVGEHRKNKLLYTKVRAVGPLFNFFFFKAHFCQPADSVAALAAPDCAAEAGVDAHELQLAREQSIFSSLLCVRLHCSDCVLFFLEACEV